MSCAAPLFMGMHASAVPETVCRRLSEHNMFYTLWNGIRINMDFRAERFRKLLFFEGAAFCPPKKSMLERLDLRKVCIPQIPICKTAWFQAVT